MCWIKWQKHDFYHNTEKSFTSPSLFCYNIFTPIASQLDIWLKVYKHLKSSYTVIYRKKCFFSCFICCCSIQCQYLKDGSRKATLDFKKERDCLEIKRSSSQSDLYIEKHPLKPYALVPTVHYIILKYLGLGRPCQAIHCSREGTATKHTIIQQNRHLT
jgi:hypothetical protein